MRALDPERLLDERTKPGPDGSGPLRLTPLQRIDRLAALVPPPRVHRHRCFGVPAPNSPLRAAMDDAASDAAASDALPAITPALFAPDFVFDQRIAW